MISVTIRGSLPTKIAPLRGLKTSLARTLRISGRSAVKLLLERSSMRDGGWGSLLYCTMRDIFSQNLRAVGRDVVHTRTKIIRILDKSDARRVASLRLGGGSVSNRNNESVLNWQT